MKHIAVVEDEALMREELADMLLRGVVVRMTKNEVKYLLTFEGTELRIKRESK